MVYKHTFVLLAVFAPSIFHQGCEASAVMRGLRKNKKHLKKHPKSSKTSKAPKSSDPKASNICSFEIAGFDPYKYVTHEERENVFDIKLDGIPGGEDKELAVIQAKETLEMGLVKHFRKKSFQKQIKDNRYHKFVFEPSTDIQLSEPSNIDDSLGDSSLGVAFTAPLFSGTIEYKCNDYEERGHDQMMREFAMILNAQFATSEGTLYKTLSKHFENLEWSFDNITVYVFG